MTHLESLEKETLRAHDVLNTQRKRLDDAESAYKRQAWYFRGMTISLTVSTVCAIGGGGLMLLWLIAPLILFPLVFLTRMATRENVIEVRHNVNISLTTYVDALTAEDEERTLVMLGNPTAVKAPESVTDARKPSKGSTDINKGLKEALDAIERRIRYTRAVPQNIIKPEVAKIRTGDFELTVPAHQVASYVRSMSAKTNRRTIQVYWEDGRCDIL
jgi:hypothetical protein